MNINFYHIASITKIVFATIILLIIYNTIHVYEDPIIGLGFIFLGIFILAWGVSYFVFLGLQKFFRYGKDIAHIQKDSYKLSLLFGIYAMLNLLLIVWEQWSKLLGIIILAIFILLHIVLLKDERKE